MKKFSLFLAPLIAISFLTNCGGKSGPKQYIVKFDLNGGTSEAIPAQTVIEGEKATEPKKPTRAGGDDAIYTFNEWQLDGNTFDFNTPITKNITLKADWNIVHKYAITVGTHKHLSFTTTDGKDLNNTKAIEGQDFKFKMRVDEESNETTYKLPTQLSIYIGDSKYPLTKDVTITETTQYLEADVTISANQITGDIKINGSAIPINYYEIKVFNYGVKISSEDFDPDYPYAESNKNKDITFVQDGSYALPTIKDIYLEVDDKNWISPEGSEYCSYDEANHKLTINANKVNSNLIIVVSSPEYKLLENLDWDDISDCSKSGFAPTLFKIGDEKTIKVNNIDQKVRIIDFNHDKDKNGNKIGITFEFANLLSDSNGYSLATLWNTINGNSSKNYDYLNSDLRKALDGLGNGTLRWYQKGSNTKSIAYIEPVIKMLPSDLQNNIKTAKKCIGTTYSYKLTDYDAKIFALTYNEITSSSERYAKVEGTTYQYYKDHDNDSSRIKQQVKGRDGAVIGSTKITDLIWNPYNYAGYNSSIEDNYGGFYWLTSPRTNSPYNAWHIHFDGHFAFNHVYYGGYAIAPAFCI